MERLDIFDIPNAFIASYTTDDRGCAHCNRDHTLLYLHSGELEITDGGRNTVLHPGDCAFMRRDNMMWMQKRTSHGQPYRSVVMKFSREYLKEFYRTLNRHTIPSDARRDKRSLYRFPTAHTALRTLFQSLIPAFDAGTAPADETLQAVMAQGMYALLESDESLYASLFDFVEPWKIDIVDFLEKNYMNDLSIPELAYYTGRSPATFKRDFKKVSELTPQKWLIRRRLQAARELIIQGKGKVSEICFDVGFKNLSHFSKLYKQTYGIAPSHS